jgi:release factor glutamine methyltransferase
MTPPAGTSAGTVAEALAAASDAFTAAGVEAPRLDAELLLEAASGRSRAQLVADPDLTLDGPQARDFGAMVRRRVAREPIAYILGHRGFRHLELIADPRALVPRPESELLVEIAVELEPATVLDVGTGGGAIALAIADEVPGASVVAVDVSVAALALAAENVAALGLSERVELRTGTATEAAAMAGFDLVVANLPYVSEGDRRSLQPEIARYEPADALFAGDDGLDAIRALLAELAPGGEGPRAAAVALEIGAGQASEVAGLVATAGYDDVETRRDLAGIERAVVGRR